MFAARLSSQNFCKLVPLGFDPRKIKLEIKQTDETISIPTQNLNGVMEKCRPLQQIDRLEPSSEVSFEAGLFKPLVWLESRINGSRASSSIFTLYF